MKIVESLIVACSMYSKIPMPQIKWDDDNMKYAMCFFPVIGVIIGIAQYFIGQLLFHMKVGQIFRAAILTLIPVLITGGIHMDGFMDTMDALSSWGDREKKLAILKDSHSGAFAILGLGCYFVLSMGVWSEVKPEMLESIAGIYVLSRALSGLSIVTFASARKKGLAQTFQQGAEKRKVKITMICFLLFGCIYLIAFNVVTGCAAILAAGITFWYYHHICYKQFGGVTGDLAGFFLQICELMMLTCIVMTGVW